MVSIDRARDGLALTAIKVAPMAIVVAVVVYILVLLAKDALNGFRKPFLRPDAWQPVLLVDKKDVTHNVRRFRFALPYPEQQLGLPVGQHISVKIVTPAGAEIIRSYTPSSESSQRGFVDFVIKVYPDGKMTQALDALKIGDKVLFKGPRGRFVHKVGRYKHLGMIAGGSGLTPMYQLLQTMLRDPNDTTKVSLIFANVNEDDILLRDELDELARQHDRLEVHYVLNNAPATWSGSSGFVTQEMIRERIAAPGDDVLVLRCGPPPMNRAVEGFLNELGYAADSVFVF